MNWENLISDHLPEANFPIVIFKHSPRCSISNMAKARFERHWPTDLKTPVYLVDVILQRPLSNAIASKFNIEHQSPQVLVIKNNKCIYTESHNGISAEEVINTLN